MRRSKTSHNWHCSKEHTDLKRFVLLAIAAVGSLHAPAAPPYKVPVQQRLFDALSRVENCKVWRNPGCLRFARQAGAYRGPQGYAVFRSLFWGQRALRRQIKAGEGQTVFEFLHHYNPGYADYPFKVAAFAGLSLQEIL